MVRAGGFEPPTAWFVARYSIQLSYARIVAWTTNKKAIQTLFQIKQVETSLMVVREGFEPSIRLQTIYSLSRGAPSASRPPHHIYFVQNGARGRIRTSDRLVRSQVLYPAELRAHRYLNTLFLETS